MICDKCKTEVSSAAKFCPKCGAKVEQAVIQDAQPVQPDAAQGSPGGGEAAARSEIKQAEAPPKNVETAAPYQAAQQGGQKTSKGPLVAIILLALLVIAGAGGYFYYTGSMGKNPTKLGEQINNELKEKGLNLYCEIDKNWTATLKGAVKSTAEKETAIGIVKAHKEVKDVKDELQPQVKPSDIKLAIDNALADAGFMDIHAEVDENLIATLGGTAFTESEKASAVSIAKEVEQVKDVKDNIQVQAAQPASQSSEEPERTLQESGQKRRDTAPLPERKLQEPRQKRRDAAPYSGPKGLYGDAQGEKRQSGAARIDPFELEVKINRALQNAGFSRVRARVGGRLNVLLKGRVASEEDKARAIEIAGSFNGIRNVRDNLVVAGY